MRRKLVNFAAALSLVLCAATIALWVRSYRASDYLNWSSSSREISCVGEQGQVLIRITKIEKPNFFQPRSLRLNDRGGLDPQWFTLDALKYTNLPMEWELRMLGMDFAAGPRDRIYSAVQVLLAHWLLATLFALLPGLWCAHRLRQQLRARANLCLTCGYDIRASLERCPECGTVLEPASKVTTAGAGDVE
jgi:hypothetical protein